MGTQSNAISNVNANNYITTGLFQVGSPTTVSNLPSGVGYGQLIVTKTRGYIRQEYYDSNGRTVYVRFSTNTGSTWSSWEQRPTRDEIDSSFKVLSGSASLTMAAGATTGYSMTDFGMSFPTGYVCLGVIQANGDTVNVLIKGIGRVANTTSNVIWLYNRSASSVTFSYGLHLLFVRSNMIG